MSSSPSSSPLGEIVGQQLPVRRGEWVFDEDDFLLIAMLSDPIYGPELVWDDAKNVKYHGCYRVMDYQYPLFRMDGTYAGAACARSVGKTESIKARSFTHAFRRMPGQNLLLSAPELIHLQPLTDAVEDRIRDTRITRDFLDLRGGKTGFTHRPFGVDFADGTKIVGRIPRLKGTGVKGQHQPDLIIDEGQDYPDAGWTEVHETVMKDTVDANGDPDFHYHFYGVHTGDIESGFHKRSKGDEWEMTQITALMRPGWGKSEKEAAIAAYGGTGAPDYRRNILGESGGASSAWFNLARLMACMDQDRESAYNKLGYVKQLLRVEDFEELRLPIGEVLDLPSGLKSVWAGMDLGLTDSPTVITIFSHEKVKMPNEPARDRLKLVRRITLERFRTKTIRQAMYAVSGHYGSALKGFGMDVTGLGFPIWQEMEDDEACPPHLLEVARGYFFNAKVPVGVDKLNVGSDHAGQMRDQFGAAVKEETDPLTGITRLVSFMPMIEASTRYLREMVDSTFLLLPFDGEVTKDMSGETQQRVKRIGELRRKPNAFHILDSMRAMAMAYRSEEVDEALALEQQVPVFDAVL